MSKLILLAATAVSAATARGENRADEAVWKDFAASLANGRITADRVRPYYPEFREAMLTFLGEFRKHARPDDWVATPELYRVGNQLHGIIRLTGADGNRVPYCFSLLLEDSTWYFQHVESIFIRLDKIGPLPASRFPDVTEGQKAWMRDERRATEQAQLFRLFVREKDRDSALALFRDGAGYALEARTWVPFVTPRKAFVLYLCWEQANLFSNPTTLESLDDDSAVVRFQPRWFKLYKQTAHLRQIISAEDFGSIFETVWQDRAQAAGWKLRINYSGDEVVLRFGQ